VFQGFREAKSANGGSILSSSQFLILPQLPQKMRLASKVAKVDSKIIISLPKIKIPETHCIIQNFIHGQLRVLKFFIQIPAKVVPLLRTLSRDFLENQ
jgi:hypothetical protein